MKKRRKNRILEALVDHRFLNSKWRWKSEDQRLSAKQRIYEKIEQEIDSPKRLRIHRLKPVLIAASIMLICAVGTYIYYQRVYITIPSDHTIAKAVAPGTQSATLTLEDGTVIDLDKAASGVLVENDGQTIRKDEHGKITYEDRGQSAESRILENKISVPPGGLYEVVLPDGTHVSLNSASTLSYPSRFSDQERRVKLTGEAYFDVVKNPKMPFKVDAGDNEIEVMGTIFNISAYAGDESIKTTLIEGGVKVSRNDTELLLTPGYQVVSNSESDYFARKRVSLDLVLGWKNGYFIFDDKDVETIMREVARWYNVEVTFRRASGKKKVLGGMFARSKSIEELLEYFEKLDVGKFEKNGRRITVMI